ncbi:MAG: winged helix-turn-helix domain-containing protein, partial [Candidatus Aenigmarchaeota archaeon]|nr:winged helix-turn-helix domain-containing protein [Candidatus Aenigmarchaeota archaeon]
SKKQTGRPRKLNEKQMTKLRSNLIKGPEQCGFDKQLWSTRMVQDYAEKKYKIKYVDRHMRRLLKKMGFSCQKPRPIHYKTDKAKQEHFKKTLRKSWVNTKNVGLQ